MESSAVKKCKKSQKHFYFLDIKRYQKGIHIVYIAKVCICAIQYCWSLLWESRFDPTTQPEEVGEQRRGSHAQQAHGLHGHGREENSS